MHFIRLFNSESNRLGELNPVGTCFNGIDASFFVGIAVGPLEWKSGDEVFLGVVETGGNVEAVGVGAVVATSPDNDLERAIDWTVDVGVEGAHAAEYAHLGVCDVDKGEEESKQKVFTHTCLHLQRKNNFLTTK